MRLKSWHYTAKKLWIIFFIPETSVRSGKRRRRGEVGNAKCGDIMKIFLKIDKDTQVITDVKFETFGCGSAIASSSMATEMIKGKPLGEALTLSNKAVAEALDGLPAHKMHCSVLAEEAIKAAVKDYYDKNGIAYDEKEFASCGTCAHCHV